MPHRCAHIDADGRLCMFYIEDGNTATTCPLHSAPSLRTRVIAFVRRSMIWRKPRTIIRDTELFLDPQQRLSRGILRCGEAIRVLSADGKEWLQVEVVRASRVPTQARGWVRRCTVQ